MQGGMQGRMQGGMQAQELQGGLQERNVQEQRPQSPQDYKSKLQKYKAQLQIMQHPDVASAVADAQAQIER